ncbi:quinolinate synthase NadA [Aureibacter tunicatorum]|uniref:Quinolinate synthase n=1 Tax=Aureibacter tunicatorum TaxID=866807 RepID=A0AAE3XPC0_9BACT|nr:quinolinate synthase NadA [Aureibacter tunicatorum]MDR6239579.1 quinolinate synthase [Aureibacter tunicatorum]BDD04056.1 quinolinate synthase A [Aureibacter tunicatorum]
MDNYSAELENKGYIDTPVNENLDLVAEIKKLKEEKNAVILGHYYITPDLQDISDYLGDSLQLARAAQETDADLIVFLGVHFMGETAKILNPNKKVILPDLKASCSLAESAPADKFAKFKEEHPDHIVLSYINCTADIKALSDVIVTSSNAVQIVNSFPKEQKIIFAPDKNLGNYINNISNREMVLWDGACIVHEQYSLEKILELKAENPGSEFIAHPECEKPLLVAADFVGSTTALLKYATQTSDSKKFIVATESGILHQMKKAAPEKTFIPAPANDSTCACNDCEFMKLNTMEKLYNCLKYELPEISLTPEQIEKAKKPILKMLEISDKLGL